MCSPRAGSVSWDQVIQHMQKSLDHLDRLGSPQIRNLHSSEESQRVEYARQFDLSRSESQKVCDITKNHRDALTVVRNFQRATFRT